jgi:hypothetical protein
MKALRENKVTIILMFLLFVITRQIESEELATHIIKSAFILLIVYNIFSSTQFFENVWINKKRIFLPSKYDTSSKLMDISIPVIGIPIILYNANIQTNEVRDFLFANYEVLLFVLLFVIWVVIQNPVTEIKFGRNSVRIKKLGKTIKKIDQIDKIILSHEKVWLEFKDSIFEFSGLRLEGKTESIVDKINQNNPKLPIEIRKTTGYNSGS